MVQMDSHDTPKISPETSSHDSVAVIESIASPIDLHISNAIEQIWLSTSKGNCSNVGSGRSVRRRAISCTVSSWLAMEAAVNKAIYLKLRHKECDFYVQPVDRSVFERDISDNFGRQLGFKKRIEYLAESKVCCSTISSNIGALGQFEKLRNLLCHGYVFRKDSLAQEVPDSSQSYMRDGKKIVVTTFSVEEEEILTPDGDQIDLLGQFKELKLLHDPTSLCSHDAARTLFLAVKILKWLDTHYGIVGTATWSFRGKDLSWSTRANTAVTHTYIGTSGLYEAYATLDDKSKRDFSSKSLIDRRKGKKESTRRTRGRRH